MTSTTEPVVTAPAAPSLIPEAPPEIETRTLLLSSLPADADLVGPPPTPQLVEDVRRFGVVVPIAVVYRPIRKRKPGGYEVLAGRRRIKAARAAGLEEIPARIVDVEQGPLPRTLTLLLQQQKPNASAELAAIEGLLQAGATEADIMRATGMSIASIRQRLRLRRLVPELRAGVDAGQVALRQARIASAMSESQQRALVEVLEETGKLTDHDVHEARSAGVAAAYADLGLDALASLPTAFAPTDVGELAPPPSFLAANGAAPVGEVAVGLLRDLLRALDEAGVITDALDEQPPEVQAARAFLRERAGV